MSARIPSAWPLGVAGLLLTALLIPLGSESAPRVGQNLETPGRPGTLVRPPAPQATGTPEQGTTRLSRQPVAFVPNLGQWDGDFSHKARMGAMTVFLQERGWTFTLVEPPQRPEPDPFARRTAQPEPASAPARGVAVRMHFEGGARPALPIEEQRLPGVHNYFLGNDPERWRSNVALHGAVLMTGLYTGIDLRARSQDGHFEYDLLVEPGADLEQVLVTVDGADGLRLDADGALVIDTLLGPVRQPLAKTWQITASGEHQEVVCRYVLRGEDAFGFEASEWDRDLALVVDPGLVYSTYLGGGGGEYANSIALDASGAATVVGNTWSTNFPTTAGAFDTSYNGGFGTGDAFITRLDLGTTIGLSQPGGPGTPITIDNGYLIPGNVYYNIFSLDLCSAGPGTGPYLGLCATTLANIQFIVLQASLPVGSPPFHFVATAPSMSWGPYTVGPGTLDAVCLDVTGGVLGSFSPVTRITIQ